MVPAMRDEGEVRCDAGAVTTTVIFQSVCHMAGLTESKSEYPPYRLLSAAGFYRSFLGSKSASVRCNTGTLFLLPFFGMTAYVRARQIIFMTVERVFRSLANT